MNKLNKTHEMTFEIYEDDLHILYHHALLAENSRTIIGVDQDVLDTGKNENTDKLFDLESRYIVTQLPHLYDFLFTDREKINPRIVDRNYADNAERLILKVNLTDDNAEKYYWVQHKLGRLGAMNALLSIYEHRQSVITKRKQAELKGHSGSYKYPFVPTEWPFSKLFRPDKGFYDAYHINTSESFSETIDKYYKLDKMID